MTDELKAPTGRLSSEFAEQIAANELIGYYDTDDIIPKMLACIALLEVENDDLRARLNKAIAYEIAAKLRAGKYEVRPLD